jgi:MoxR-like ATPase
VSPSDDTSPYGSPVEALRRVLNHFVAQHSEDETVELWRRYAAEASDQAAILLRHLDEVLADPPADLPEIVRSDGEVELEDDEGRPASVDEHREWLRGLVARLRQAYDEEEASPEAVLRDFLRRFWLDHSPEVAFHEWRAYAAGHGSEADAILASLHDLAEHPPDELANLLRTWGWIDLHHDDLRPYSPDEVADWFRTTVGELERARQAG